MKTRDLIAALTTEYGRYAIAGEAQRQETVEKSQGLVDELVTAKKLSPLQTAAKVARLGDKFAQSVADLDGDRPHARIFAQRVGLVFEDKFRAGTSTLPPPLPPALGAMQVAPRAAEEAPPNLACAAAPSLATPPAKSRVPRYNSRRGYGTRESRALRDEAIRQEHAKRRLTQAEIATMLDVSVDVVFKVLKNH